MADHSLPSLEELMDKAGSLQRLGNMCEAQRLYTDIISRGGEILTADKITTGDSESIHNIIALAYNNRGHLKYLQVNFKEAVEDYSAGLQYKALAIIHYNRGLIHYRMGCFAEAVVDQKAALELDPNLTSARHCMEQATRDMHHKEAPS